MTKHTELQFVEYYVKGMHCGSCELIVERSLIKHNNVKNVKASLVDEKVAVYLDQLTDNIHFELGSLLKDLGYSLHIEPVTKEKTNYKELVLAFLIALGFLALFILLQKLGIVNLLNADQVTLPFVFLIGVVASLST